jgi:hypothetical protein
MSADVSTLVNELLDLGDGAADLAFEPSFAGDPEAVAFGWYQWCRRTSMAALVLHERGFPLEAAPLRRSLFEHAINLRWLAASPAQCVDAMQRKNKMRVEQNRRALVNDWGIDPADLSGAINIDLLPENPEQNLLSFGNLLAQHGVPNFTVAYWAESNMSHPSIQTAGAHTAKDQSVGDPDEVVALFLTVATEAYSSMLIGNPLGTRLSDFWEKLSVAMAASRTDRSHI